MKPIGETSEGEGDTTPPLLLIDAKNALYRVAYASKSVDEGILILLRLMHTWIKQFKPQLLIAAWDAPRNTVWRRDVHPGYKDRDGSKYVDDLGPRIAAMQTVCHDLFEALGIKNLARDRMEADDLIYACAAVISPSPCIVISSDSDMTQIPHSLRNVRVFNGQKNCFSESTSILLKALAGDRSDSVKGYDGIGKVKASRILKERVYRESFFRDKGFDTLREALLLVDLASCPYLLDNKIYCLQELSKASCANTQLASDIIRNHKLKMVFMEQQGLFEAYKSIKAY
jgi:5'-3' exonuclease